MHASDFKASIDDALAEPGAQLECMLAEPGTTPEPGAQLECMLAEPGTTPTAAGAASE